MEAIYFYESNKEKDVKSILGTDEFMRISFTTKIGGHNDKVGYHIYIIGNCEELNSLENKFSKLGLTEIFGESKDKIISKFKADADNAASGMGLIFG